MQSIAVQDAVKNAKKTLLDLYADDPPKALALEEVEFFKDDKQPLWSITLGFYRPKSVSAVHPTGSMASIFSQPALEIENRVYKTVFIDANTGDFVKMDMRQIR
jgi:hypothetical protein